MVIYRYEIYGYGDIWNDILNPQNERLVKKTFQFSLKYLS